MNSSFLVLQILSEHQGPTEREFEVFYIDYGNQEIVAYSCLRPAPANQSTSLIPPLAKLFRLAFITVPNLTDDLGEQAARYLSMVLLDNEKEFKATVEERGNVGARQEGQGTGEVLIVTLLDEDAESSVNAALLEVSYSPLSISSLSMYNNAFTSTLIWCSGRCSSSLKLIVNVGLSTEWLG